jgi:hypothetical protein
LRGEGADSTVWAYIDEKAYPDWSVRAVFVADRTTRSAHVASRHVEHYEGEDAPPTGNARMMHAVRPGRLHQLAEDARRREFAVFEDDELENLGRAIGRQARSPRVGRPRKESKDLALVQLVQQYLELADSPRPLVRLAQELQLSKSTISGRLQLARERGLLVSAGHGKAGGRLTPRAKRILKKGDT